LHRRWASGLNGVGVRKVQFALPQRFGLPMGVNMLSPRSFYKLTRQSISAWSDDYAPSMGAAIAYYTIFSLAPLLLLVIATAGMIFGREAVQGEIVGQVTGLMGKDGAAAIEGLIASASKPATSAFATIVSFGLLLLGATSVFAEIQNAMDRIWHVPAAKRPGSAFDFIRTRVLSFGLILGLAFLLLVSLVVSAGVAALGTWWGAYFEGWETVLQVLNTATSLLFSSVLFGMIYKLLPRPHIAWRDVWTGALFTAALFEIGKFGIGLYLGKSGVSSGFGAAGSLVVLLVWVYYSSQIFLLGAEFTRQYALSHDPKREGTTPSQDERAEAHESPLVNRNPSHQSGFNDEDRVQPTKDAPLFIPPHGGSVPATPNATKMVTETAAEQGGNAVPGLGLGGNVAARLRGLARRRSTLSAPAIGLMATVGIITAIAIAKYTKTRKLLGIFERALRPEGNGRRQPRARA